MQQWQCQELQFSPKILVFFVKFKGDLIINILENAKATIFGLKVLGIRILGEKNSSSMFETIWKGFWIQFEHTTRCYNHAACLKNLNTGALNALGKLFWNCIKRKLKFQKIFFWIIFSMVRSICFQNLKTVEFQFKKTAKFWKIQINLNTLVWNL